MPPRPDEEAISFDRELMRLSDEIMNFDGQLGRNPSNAALAHAARLQQQYEDRHEAIRREIEEEARASEHKAEAEAWEAKYKAKPGATEFAAYLESLGKSASTVSMLKSLFLNLHTLAIQPKGIKDNMRWRLDAFIKELTEEQLAKYSAVLDEVVEATGDVDPGKFNPNPAARDFTAFLQSIGVEDGDAYFLGDLFSNYEDLVDQPQDIRKEMIAALDAFVQELTKEQLSKYSTVIDEAKMVARTGTENVGKT